MNYYGIAISLGGLISLLVIERLVKDKKFLWDLSFWTILMGIIGARLYHVIDYSTYYSMHPNQIISINNGGMGIWGGLISGILTVFIYTRIKKRNTLAWLDTISIGMPLAQAIGRWGNMFNKELFGIPTNLPWKIFIPEDLRPSVFKNNEYFHPLFLYESILNTILFILLFISYRKNKSIKKHGYFFYLYLIGYSVIRFSLDFLRIDAWHVGLLNVSQTLSILLILISVYLIRKENK